MSTSVSLRFAATIWIAAAALSLALYFPTLRNAWAYDDVDYINVSAGVLTGERSLSAALWLSQGEHLIPAFRLLLLAYLKVVGLDAFLWRFMVVLLHATAAMFLALIALRYTGSRRAGMTAAMLYAGACGFSSMWIWFPSGATVPLAFAWTTAAAALLAWRDHLFARRIAAGVLVVLAMLAESAFLPLAILPATIDEIERRGNGARRAVGPFTIFTIAAMGIVAFVTTRLMATPHGPINIWKGLPRAVYLVLVAPFRLFFPGIPVFAVDPTVKTAVLGSVLGIVVGGVILALLAGLWRRGIPKLAIVAVLSSAGPLGIMLLVGVGRWWTSYRDLYEADRYFFPLLIPIALLAAAVSASISFRDWPRSARAIAILAIVTVITGELALHRRAMLRRIPFVIYETHGRRFASLAEVSRLLETAAVARISNKDLWFSDVHNGHIDPGVLTHVLGSSRVRVTPDRIDDETAARLNPMLDALARHAGDPVSFIRVVDGHLVNTRFVPAADLRHGLITRGRGELKFNMAPSGVYLTLESATPLPSRVRVTLIDDSSGFVYPLGAVDVAAGGPREFQLPSKIARQLGHGRVVRLVLECDQPIRVHFAGTRLPDW